MAKICSNCSCKNKNKDAFCKECGASLADAVEIADGGKGKRIKQEQNPVARKVLAIVLIATCVLCLFTTLQYVSGAYSVKVVNSLNKDIPLGIDSLEDAYEFFTNHPEDTTTHENIWHSISDFLRDSSSLDNFKDNSFLFLSILSQLCNTVTYLLLAILTALTAVLVLMRYKHASIFVWIAAIACLLCILGSVVGYFLVSKDQGNMAVFTTKAHLVPQTTFWFMLPLFLQLPILALMLPAKNKDKLPE